MIKDRYKVFIFLESFKDKNWEKSDKRLKIIDLSLDLSDQFSILDVPSWLIGLIPEY